MTTGGLVPCRRAARMVRAGGSRFSSREFQPFPPPVRVLSGMRKKAASPLQRVSAIFLEGLLPSPAPEQFSPVAGGTPQIWPTGFRSLCSIVMQRNCGEVQSFSRSPRKNCMQTFPERHLVANSGVSCVPARRAVRIPATAKTIFQITVQALRGREPDLCAGLRRFSRRRLRCSRRAPPAHRPRNCSAPWAR